MNAHAANQPGKESIPFILELLWFHLSERGEGPLCRHFVLFVLFLGSIQYIYCALKLPLKRVEQQMELEWAYASVFF